MTNVRELADKYHGESLDAHPFYASELGIRGRDDCVPDESEEGDHRRRSQIEAVLARAGELRGTTLSGDEIVTVDALLSAAREDLAELDMAVSEYTVTTKTYFGPPLLMATAARTILTDARAAEDFVTRLRRSGRWIDQLSDRLRSGASKGRYPIANAVEATIAWGEKILGDPIPEPLAALQPPQGWSGEAAWRSDLDNVVMQTVKPAIGRWVELLRELLPRSRPAEQAGLAYLPGGEADYARAIEIHTTLSLSAEELHETGLEEVDRLEERCRRLGHELGLEDLSAVHAAMRSSAGNTDPRQSMADALVAVRRAESRAGEVFPEPLPPPCDVSAMPKVVASSGMAPHYTPPRLDGSRPGTYWFNTELQTAGTGWDLEGVAFHEAVPGHHLQLSRIQQLTNLSDFQRQRSITVFSEGWGLYAEDLAEEMGLYSGTEALIGATTASLMRGVRLVVDTGMHAFGWSPARALEYFTSHVPMPEAFLASEIDRYIVRPGQALAYLTGKREIVGLRHEAEGRLGSRFSLPEFHAAILDHGSIPMPVLRNSVEEWTASQL